MKSNSDSGRNTSGYNSFGSSVIPSTQRWVNSMILNILHYM